MWRAVEAFTLHLLSIFLKSRTVLFQGHAQSCSSAVTAGVLLAGGGACPVLAHLGPLLASATVLASGVVGAAGIARPALPGGTGLSPGLPPRVTVT